MRLALIKKISFKYNSLPHSALVSVSGTRGKLLIHVQLIDSFLKKISGVEHIRFKNFSGEIIIAEVKHPCVHSIVKPINLQLIEGDNEFEQYCSEGIISELQD